jgi:hypothetical protein
MLHVCFALLAVLSVAEENALILWHSAYVCFALAAFLAV